MTGLDKTTPVGVGTPREVGGRRETGVQTQETGLSLCVVDGIVEGVVVGTGDVEPVVGDLTDVDNTVEV